MKSRDSDRYNAFIAANQFGKENAADFPANSIGGSLFAEIAECITLLNRHGANQSSAMSSSKQNYVSKDTAREDLREELTDISRMARSMAYEIEGLDDKFRFPVNRNDRQLLTTARAFLADAAQYKTKFIDYGLPKDFLENLQSKIEDFEATLSTTSESRGMQVASTAEIGAIVRRGMIALRRLNPIVRQKYKNNTGKLAAWTTAKHVKRQAVNNSAPIENTKE